MKRRIILGHPNLLIPWADMHIPWGNYRFDHKSNTVGIAVNDRIVCVAIYHDYYPDCKHISMSIGAENAVWAGRDTIGALLGFPFLELGCNRISAFVAASNTRSRKLVEGVGFKQEGQMRDLFGPGEDGLCFGMLKSEADVWLKHCPVGLYRSDNGTGNI